MKRTRIRITGLLLLLMACQGEGTINDTIKKDSVHTIRRPDDHTEVDKLTDTSPALKKWDSINNIKKKATRKDSSRNN